MQTMSDEDLLRELIRRNAIRSAPRSRTMHDVEVIIGIGKDNHCYITFGKDDFDALTGGADGRHTDNKV